MVIFPGTDKIIQSKLTKLYNRPVDPFQCILTTGRVFKLKLNSLYLQAVEGS